MEGHAAIGYAAAPIILAYDLFLARRGRINPAGLKNGFSLPQ